MSYQPIRYLVSMVESLTKVHQRAGHGPMSKGLVPPRRTLPGTEWSPIASTGCTGCIAPLVTHEGVPTSRSGRSEGTGAGRSESESEEARGAMPVVMRLRLGLGLLWALARAQARSGACGTLSVGALSRGSTTNHAVACLTTRCGRIRDCHRHRRSTFECSVVSPNTLPYLAPGQRTSAGALETLTLGGSL